MTCGNLETKLPCELCSGAETPKLVRLAVRIANRMGVFSRVKLDLVHAKGAGRLDLLRIWRNKQAHANRCILQSSNETCERVLSPGNFESALGGAFLASLRYKRHNSWFDSTRNRNHFVGRGHLEIKHRGDGLAETLNIGIAYVAPVFTKMRRDALGTSAKTRERRLNRIGVRGASRIPQRSHMVDIDMKAHRHERGR